MANQNNHSWRVLSKKEQLCYFSESVTNIPVTKFNHLWTINNFRTIPSNVDFICCSNFSPPNSEDKWFMKLRPKSVDEASGIEYIGVHLFLRSCQDDKKSQIRAKYVFSVLDTEGERRFRGLCSRTDGRIFKANTEGHGYRLLAQRDAVLNSNVLGPNDSLQILCEITAFGEINSTIITSVSHDSNLYSEKDYEEGSIISDLSALNKSQYGCDIVIEMNDGVQLKAHKLMLQTRSKVFDAMFDHDTKEKAENKVQILDFDSSVIKEMINFIYCDSVDAAKLSEFAEDLLIAADKYDLPKLKKLCEQYLVTNDISEESCGRLLALSDCCNCFKLKEKVMQLILNNPEKVSDCDEWEEQVCKRPHLYKEAIKALIKKQRTK